MLDRRYGRRWLSAAAPLVALTLAVLTTTSADAATYEVTTAADSGPGSLRQAILDANANPGEDSITFNIPGAGPHTILPLTGLPAVTGPTDIDGRTQPGYAGAPLVALEGSGLSPSVSPNGIHLVGSSSLRGLSVYGFFSDVTLGDSNIVAGNYLGMKPDGSAPAAADSRLETSVYMYQSSNNVIGGSSASDRNVIGGKGRHGTGIHVYQSTSTLIVGNYIGVDPTGLQVRALELGILIRNSSKTTVGGPSPGERNVIAGAEWVAVEVDYSDHSAGPTPTDTRILGNFIGVGADGSTILRPSNGTTGAAIYASLGTVSADADGDVKIGGVTPGSGNTIAGWGTGIAILGGKGHTITGNSFRAIADGSIDLVTACVAYYCDWGPTPNDPLDTDTGANNGQNYPDISSAATNAGQTVVIGTLSSNPNTSGFRVELFSSPACLTSGYGPGQTFLGATTVSTNASGDASFTVSGLPAVPLGHVITATATHPDGSTSEFSRCSTVGAGAVLVTPTSGLQTTEAGGQATLTVRLSSVPTSNVTVQFSTSNPAEGTVTPSTLTFTPANALAPRTVTVTGVDDTFFDGNITYTVVTSPAASTDPTYSGTDPADVTLVNLDNEGAPPNRPGATPTGTPQAPTPRQSTTTSARPPPPAPSPRR
ncbi:MAG: right-handed parallel beta-helix repeat-containing protein [Chloroflexota bacterium]